jgi:hypothetical protein
MANQSIRLSTADTARLRANISEGIEINKIVENKIYTPTPEAVDNFISANEAVATNDILNAANVVNGDIKYIKENYTTFEDANNIAKKNAMVFGG